MGRRRLALVLLIFMTGAGCTDRRTAEKPIAQAWTGPVTLKLRAELHPDSPAVGEVKHGEPLDVLQVRRRFVRVRSKSSSIQGWTEMRNLMGEEKMTELAQLAKEARKLPSMGEATVYEPLNVHTEPSRPSTSFYQLTEGVRVDVVGGRLAPRKTGQPPMPFRIEKQAPAPRKKRSSSKIPPVPRPAGPGLPANWIDLSKSTLPPEPPEPPPPPVPMEEWTLIRTKDKRAGWVLSRNLVMAIPDEVAQYSEGARITSYFPLGNVREEDGQMKHHWLWTTVRSKPVPYHFDSFRVFIYNLRRHRYETSLIERRVEGYYPVAVEETRPTKFSLILRGEDGQLHRKTWVLEGYLTRLIAEEPYEMPKEGIQSSDDGSDDEEEEDDLSEDGDQPSLVEKLKSMFRKTS